MKNSSVLNEIGRINEVCSGYLEYLEESKGKNLSDIKLFKETDLMEINSAIEKLSVTLTEKEIQELIVKMIASYPSRQLNSNKHYEEALIMAWSECPKLIADKVFISILKTEEYIPVAANIIKHIQIIQQEFSPIYAALNAHEYFQKKKKEYHGPTNFIRIVTSLT